MTVTSFAPYWRRLPSGPVIASTQPEHAEALESLQRVVFPTLTDAQRFKAAHYHAHLRLFPEGQFVALDGPRVVAATTTLRRHVDLARPHHTFDEVIQGGWLTSHEPEGDWLYGADVSVHPDHRRRGLARGLYAARQELVWALGLRGQVSAGMLRGYGDLRDRMTAAEYLDEVRAGRRTDPTLTMQQRIGFELRALLPDHLHDPACANYAALIVLDASRDVPGAIRPSTNPR